MDRSCLRSVCSSSSTDTQRECGWSALASPRCRGLACGRQSRERYRSTLVDRYRCRSIRFVRRLDPSHPLLGEPQEHGELGQCPSSLSELEHEPPASLYPACLARSVILSDLRSLRGRQFRCHPLGVLPCRVDAFAETSAS